MDNSIITSLAAWFLPGAGHILQKRWKRGLLIAVSIWTLFIVGVFSGGAYYPGFDFKDGQLLYLLNIFSRFGNGLGLVITSLFFGQPPPNVAAIATFEYGGRFLEIAGLLNFLAVIDSADINLGRKR